MTSPYCLKAKKNIKHRLIVLPRKHFFMVFWIVSPRQVTVDYHRINMPSKTDGSLSSWMFYIESTTIEAV